MIRRNVEAFGMLVDILEWDGNIAELQSFSPDDIFGETDGVMLAGSLRDGIHRHLKHGDLMVRPAGRADISPLNVFRESWWATALGLVEKK